MRTDNRGNITRRGVLEAGATGAAAGLLAAASRAASQDDRPDAKAPFDLLLKGGHVIDPANGLNAPSDVAVADGRVAAVAAEIPAAGARRVVDVKGLYVAPGFIDLHAHVLQGKDPMVPALPVDLNLNSGVTTIVDAGSWGAENFQQVKSNVIDVSEVRVLAFLNVLSCGMTHDEKEQTVAYMDPQRCAATIGQYPGTIVGVKTAHYWDKQPWDAEHPPWAAVDRAIEAGRLADKPVMIDFWPRPPQRPVQELVLTKMRPGDILTHVFAQQYPVLDGQGKVSDYLREGRRRGVLFDLGHGFGSFWFRNAAPAIRQRFLPDSLGTDLYTLNANGPVVDMITTMSKILALGARIEEVIRAVTVNPARAIRRPELGTLTVGREADIAVFALHRGRFGYTDCGCTRMVGDVKLENLLTVRAGQVLYDPTGLSMVEWTQAPPQYYTIPPVNDPERRASADPQWRRRTNRQKLEALKEKAKARS